MTGRQLKNQGLGSTNEAFCEALLGQMASMIPVPREHDFGVDFYCLPRVPSGSRSEAVVALAGVQVKSSSGANLEFGGADDGDPKSWRRYELEYLQNLRLPYYLAVVQPKFTRLDLYSITRSLQVFWKTSYPYVIECTVEAPNLANPFTAPEPTSKDEVPATQEHDGKRWTVNLGAPLLSLDFALLSSAANQSMYRNVLLGWIGADRWSVDNLAMGVPVVRLVQPYFTNLPPTKFSEIMFWHPGWKHRAAEMTHRLAPGVVCVARQLLSDGRSEEAALWKGALQSCEAAGALSPFGRDVLKELS